MEGRAQVIVPKYAEQGGKELRKMGNFSARGRTVIRSGVSVSLVVFFASSAVLAQTHVEKALLEVAAEGKAALVETMLTLGANVNARDGNGRTALMLAAREGHTETVAKLLSAGADTSAEDRDGNTASTLAEQHRHIEVSQLFQTDIDQWQLWWELNTRGMAGYQRGQFTEAEDLYLSALERAKSFGTDSIFFAGNLYSLATLYHAQGKYREAEPLYRRSLALKEKALGLEHPDVATSLNNLALLHISQSKYGEAEPLYQRSLAILEKTLGPEHPHMAISLNNLALLYRVQGRHGEAEPLYQRCLTILEKALGPEHPNVAQTLENYAALLRETGRTVDAAKMDERAQKIRAKVC